MAGRASARKTRRRRMTESGWMSITPLMKTPEKWWESWGSEHFPLAVALRWANGSLNSCQAEKLQSIPVEERKAKAAAVSGSRLLTQDDFKKIRLAQIAKEVDAAAGKGQKRKMADIDNEDDSRLAKQRRNQTLAQRWSQNLRFVFNLTEGSCWLWETLRNCTRNQKRIKKHVWRQRWWEHCPAYMWNHVSRPSVVFTRY